MTTINPLYTRADYGHNLPKIFAAVQQLKELEAELNRLFPEREFVIHQMMLAILMRMNVLIYGIYGSGKSFLMDCLMDGIGVDRDEVFSIDMTRYTTEADLFGATDLPAMRELGILRRNPDGSIRSARFATIDEIFDALHILRSLLGVLNERRYRRGADSGPVPLHTAVAATNMSPAELLRILPNAGAVIDRFLFQSQVHWLKDEGSLLGMFANYLRGMTPETRVDHADLMLAVDLITSPTDQIDINSDLLISYVRIVTTIRREWKKNEGWRQFSDRAFTQWLSVLETSALLNGRYEVNPVDFYELRYVACDGGNVEQLETFERVVVPLIEEAVKNSQAMSLDDAVNLAIQGIRSNWPVKPDGSTSPRDLVDIRRKLGKHLEAARAMRPQLPGTQGAVRDLTNDIKVLIDHVDHLINGS